MSFTLTVDGFSEGGEIPSRFTCDENDAIPALRWSGEPANTKSFALILDDPDAPSGTFNHWLLWNIPPHVHILSQGSGHDSVGTSGVNDFNKHGYGGPCPPKGHGPHRYYFHLFALDTPTLNLPEGANRSDLDQALADHILATAEYMGRYKRS